MDAVMRPVYRLLLLAIFPLLFSSQQAFATHFAAVDLYVKYIGTGPGDYTYEVTLEVFKSCEWPTPFGNADLNIAETVRFRSVGANVNGTIDVDDIDHINTVHGDTLDQLCPGFKPDNLCRNPASIYPAFVRKVYKGTVTLPSAEPDWQFWWRAGNRNNGITNINAPGGYFIFVECGLNNQLKFDNSSPQFTEPPYPYFCINQPVTFLNQPFDPDGDSLYTYAQLPKDDGAPAGNPGQLYGLGPWDDILYQGPYNLANPVNSSSGYSVDPFSGAATFTPVLVGKYVLGFRCDEYDRSTGIRTGYIFRDVQVSVLDCQSQPPSFSPVTNLEGAAVVGERYFTCPGNTLKFNISATSQLNTNVLSLEANNDVAIPGSIFTPVNNGSNNPSATFEWTPTFADIGDHSFIITAKDSTCIAAQPILLKTYKVIQIKVLYGVSAGPDLRICPGTSKQIIAQGPDSLTYQWSPSEGLSNPNTLAPVAGPKSTTQYILTAPLLTGFCKSTDTVDVVVDVSNTMDVKPDNPAILCRPGYMQLDAATKGAGPKTNISCGTSNPIYCNTPAEITVLGPTTTGGFPAVAGPQDTLHVNPATYRTFATDVLTSKQQFLINRHRMLEWGVNSGTIKSLAFHVVNTPSNTYQYNNFRISLKCVDSAGLGTEFETGMIPVYVAPSAITLPPGWNKFTFQTPYNWDTTKHLVIEICYSNNPVALAAGNNPLISYVRRADPADANGNPRFLRLANIPTSGATTTDACQEITGLVRDPLRPAFRFEYCEAPSGDFVYDWTPGTFLSDSTIQSPLAYVQKSIKYKVTTKGYSGCLLKDSADIFVPNQHYRVTPSDTSICYGEATPIEVYVNGEIKQPEDGGMQYYQWLNPWFAPAVESIDNVTRPQVMASPKETITYKILVVDSVGCRDTLSARVEVRPLPKVDILGNDTLVKYGTSIQLLANGARLYSWDPVSSLNNPNTSHPVATPLEPTMYTVTGIGANGCRASDTLKVDLDMRDKLFIPTAFSPNGDGKNDIFKVTNLTFQRLVEFRVYNRWGQEVYSTNDNNKGWDGSWKGVPQEIGNYQYLIRVAYPDGYLDTYKGDVTLVR